MGMGSFINYTTHLRDRRRHIFNNATILITGHTGFKGSWLSIWLRQLGARVVGISLDVPTQPSHFVAAGLDQTMEDYRLDIRDGVALSALIKDIQPDFVFHLAAQSLVRRSYTDPVLTWQTNVLGTVNVLEALRGLKKPCVAVMITSDKCYENVEWLWGYRETDSLGGPDPYSASKGAAELAIRSYVQSYFPKSGSVRIGVGRAGNVIGGGDWAADRIVPDCVRAWSGGETVMLRNPNATRPWQHVLEPLSGYLELAMALHRNSKLHGEPFNFGPDMKKNYSVGELVLAMTSHWDQVRVEHALHEHQAPYESFMLHLNCDKALHHLKWHAILDFETTVQMTTEWYRNFYANPKDILLFSQNQIQAYTDIANKSRLS